MIKVEYLHHVSLAVTDLEKAKHFYGEVLGLKEMTRPPFDFPGAWYAIGSQQLHLIVHPDSIGLRKNGGIDSRDGHFAIRVASYQEALEHLKGKNVQLVEKPDSDSGFAQIFIMDPDNNLIELHVDQKDLDN